MAVASASAANHSFDTAANSAPQAGAPSAEPSPAEKKQQLWSDSGQAGGECVQNRTSKYGLSYMPIFFLQNVCLLGKRWNV